LIEAETKSRRSTRRWSVASALKGEDQFTVERDSELIRAKHEQFFDGLKE
jgi:hypothetical protein